MKRETDRERRAFLRKVAIMGGGAALLLGGGRAEAAAPPGEPPRREEPARGYRVTGQVRRYYERARA